VAPLADLPDWPLVLGLLVAGVVLGAVGVEAWWRNRGDRER
jgi:hypothetical protein